MMSHQNHRGHRNLAEINISI